MRGQASPIAGCQNDLDATDALAPAIGVINGCMIGLGCWAGLLWLVFG